MKIKEGVKILGVRPEIMLGAMVVESVFQKHELESVITSGIDGKHKRSSAHYSGRALDFRIRQIPGYEPEGNKAPAVIKIHQEILDRVGDNFDALLEGNHIHLEFDPKVPVDQ